MSTANVEVPYVQRTEYSLIDINEDFLSLMDEKGSTRQDIRYITHHTHHTRTFRHPFSGSFFLLLPLFLLSGMVVDALLFSFNPRPTQHAATILQRNEHQVQRRHQHLRGCHGRPQPGARTRVP